MIYLIVIKTIAMETREFNYSDDLPLEKDDFS